MARNQTLLKILTDVRGEARLSMNPAHNLADRDAQIGLIQREQERLWADHDWPFLRVSRYIPVSENTRFYDPRNAYDETWAPRDDLSLERLEDVSIFDGGKWQTLTNGIDDTMRYRHDGWAGGASWPARHWDRAEDDMIEIWPMPDASAVPALDQTTDTPALHGVLRVRGIRDLKPFRDDEDRADLDDRMLVLFSAAAILAESGAKDTNLKLEAATRHLTRLKADQDKREPFSLFGVNRPRQPERTFVGVYGTATRSPQTGGQPAEGTPHDFIADYEQAAGGSDLGTDTDYVALYEQAQE